MYEKLRWQNFENQKRTRFLKREADLFTYDKYFGWDEWRRQGIGRVAFHFSHHGVAAGRWRPFGTIRNELNRPNYREGISECIVSSNSVCAIAYRPCNN